MEIFAKSINRLNHIHGPLKSTSPTPWGSRAPG